MAEFTVDGAKRIVKATRWVEDRPRSKVSRGVPPNPSMYNKIGVVYDEITQAYFVGNSGNESNDFAYLQAGVGQVQPLKLEQDGYWALTDFGENGYDTVFNWTGDVIPQGYLVHYQIVDGFCVLVGFAPLPSAYGSGGSSGAGVSSSQNPVGG